MSLQSGSRFGPYEIIAQIGAGAMGEVYRALDTRLHRQVAIKVLPESVAKDQDRLRRFEQEARSVAALNHPNILALYDIGQDNGAPYLVTELLEGESLRSAIREGTLPERKRLDHAAQIAKGLAAAHEKGVVHRDLKPENVFVSKSGQVKILDFGLAKLAEHDGRPGDPATLTRLETSPGIAVGTPAYMSPEQLRGLPADHRSDIFSFGLVLCEMFSGRHPFYRSTPVETMNAILTADPFPDDGAVDGLPHGIQHIVSHCLEKDPQHRFQSAQDLAFDLAVLSGSARSIVTPAPREASRLSRWWPRLRLAAEAMLLLALATTAIVWPRREGPSARFTAAILPPPGEGFWANLTEPAVISPDGKLVAIVSMQNGATQLWLRRMDSPDAQLVTGTAGAGNPFWSPDSRFVGFFAGNRLKKLDTAGGAITEVCPIESFGFGGTWSSRGVIVFAVMGHALRQVSEDGGVPEAIPGVALSSNALGHLWPVFLPDGRHLLFMDWTWPEPVGANNATWAASLDGERPRRLSLTGTRVRYAAGYLLFARDGDLVAQKFDVNSQELSGAALPLARHIQFDLTTRDPAFTVSETGVLIYANEGTGVNSELTWVDRHGTRLEVLGEPAHFMLQAISPDGARVAVGVKDIHDERIWSYDVSRGTRVPVSSSDATNPNHPIWSPDGKWIAYRIAAGRVTAVKVRASDGSGEARQIGPDSTEVIAPSDWSHNGYLLLDHWPIWNRNAHSGMDVWTLDDNSKPVMKMNVGGHVGRPRDARVSYDGHWLAYCGDDDQLYVTSFPKPGAPIAIAAGGYDPRWRADGQELFYLGKDRTLTAAQIHETADDFRVTSSGPLFRLPLPDNVGFYDVTPDGQRFLINMRTHLEQSAPLTVITDWSRQFRPR